MANAKKSATKKVKVRTPNVPGYSANVDATKYAAMKTVILKVVPKAAPGVTQTEMLDAAHRAAPKDLFPGNTSSWWGKCVQLDLEARGVLKRDGGKPLRWRRVR